MTSNSNSSSDGPTSSEQLDSNPNQTVITGGSPSVEQTEISGGPGAGNSSATFDNAGTSTPTSTKDQTTEKAKDQDFAYSKENGDKPTGDAEIAQAVSFLKTKLDEDEKKLKDLKEKDRSIGAGFEDVFENFLQMFEKLKTMWSMNNTQREMARVQNPDAPDHRGHVEEVLQERNEADWMNMQKKQDEVQRSNFTSFFLPSAAKDMIARRQIGDKINDKFTEDKSMFKPNQPEANKPSANKDAADTNDNKNESAAKNDSGSSSTPSFGGGMGSLS